MLSSATIAALARYDWPGNVRELQNVLAALAVRARSAASCCRRRCRRLSRRRRDGRVLRLDEARRTFEERFVRAALVRSGGHRAAPPKSSGSPGKV